MSCHYDSRPLQAADSSEGDSNLSPHRRSWQQRHIDQATRELLARDRRHFLRQSLSTPCLEVLAGCRDSTLVSLQGREYLDFHGNSAHPVGFGHPQVIEAVTRQMAAHMALGHYTHEKNPVACAAALVTLEEALAAPEEP